MPFSSQKSIIGEDLNGNIYHIYEVDQTVKLIYFDKAEEEAKTFSLCEHSTGEFDAALDSQNTLYVLTAVSKGSLYLSVFHEGSLENHLLLDDSPSELLNITLLFLGETLHLFYGIVTDPKGQIEIMHHILKDEDWETVRLGTVSVREVLHPFVVFTKDSQLYFTYYDTDATGDRVFLRLFREKEGWSSPIPLIEDRSERKIFFDCLPEEQKTLHLVYGVWEEGNLSVQYERGVLDQENHTFLSQKKERLTQNANASYPTLILEQNRLWVVWTEYRELFSVYSDDHGDSFSPVYLWDRSKEKPFLRYRFIENPSLTERPYRLNHTYGTVYPALSFLGFGDLTEASPKEAVAPFYFDEKGDLEKMDPVGFDKSQYPLTARNRKRNLPNHRGGFSGEDLHPIKEDLKSLSARLSKLEKDTDLLLQDLSAFKDRFNAWEEKEKNPDRAKVSELSDTLSFELNAINSRIVKIENYLKNRILF